MRRRCVGNGDESKRCSKRLWSGETVDRGEKGRIEGSRHSRESRESHLSVLLIIIINSNLGVSHHRRVRRAGGAGRACPWRGGMKTAGSSGMEMKSDWDWSCGHFLPRSSPVVAGTRVCGFSRLHPLHLEPARLIVPFICFDWWKLNFFLFFLSLLLGDRRRIDKLNWFVQLGSVTFHK